MKKLDPVTLEILSHAFDGIAEEMAVVEYRSSFSPIIREMLEFSCGLFDPEGRMVAHSEQIPAQLGLMQFALRAALELHGRLAPGDGVIVNHPYHGGTHTPDLQVFLPVYRAACCSARRDHRPPVDIGGRVPGTESAETRLSRKASSSRRSSCSSAAAKPGRLRRYRSQRTGSRRHPWRSGGAARRLPARLGATRRAVYPLTTGAVQSGDGRPPRTDVGAHRRRLTTWPSRRVEAEGCLDDDGLNPGDLCGSPPRTRYERERSTSISRHRTPESRRGERPVGKHPRRGVLRRPRFVGREIRQNDGLTRHIEVSAPEGTILHPRFPAAVSARHLTVQRLADVLVGRSATCCRTAQSLRATSPSRPSSSKQSTRARAA